MNKNNNKRRREALKRISLAAGTSALVMATGSSLLATLSSCAEKERETVADKKIEEPQYSNSFPITADSTMNTAVKPQQSIAITTDKKTKTKTYTDSKRENKTPNTPKQTKNPVHPQHNPEHKDNTYILIE